MFKLFFMKICFLRYSYGAGTGTGTVTFSKVGTGTITFQKLEPEPEPYLSKVRTGTGTVKNSQSSTTLVIFTRIHVSNQLFWIDPDCKIQIQILLFCHAAVFRIHDIFVWILIRICGSMPLANGSGFGSCYFCHRPSLIVIIPHIVLGPRI